MARLTTAVLGFVALTLTLAACCSAAVGTVDGGSTGATGGLGGDGCIIVQGSCYGNSQCPAGSECDSRTYACCQSGTATSSGNGGTGSNGSGSSAGSGGTSGGTVTGSCLNGAQCPTGSTCNMSNWNCYSTSGSTSSSGSSGASSGGLPDGSCAGGQSCPPGSVCNSTNLICYTTGSTGGTSGATSGASSGGGTGVTGSCFDGGTCPQGSTCDSSSLCMGPLGGNGGSGSSGGNAGSTSGSPPYFWSGGTTGGATGGSGANGGASSGGSTGATVLGTCWDGGTCPQGTHCDAQNSICYGTPTIGSSGGSSGGQGSTTGGSSGGGQGGGASCNPSLSPSSCPKGLFCDPQSSSCQRPIQGEPCDPSVGCVQPATCVASNDGNVHLCQIACTDDSQCKVLVETCQTTTQFQGKSCQINSCSDYFENCNVSGTNDGSCLLPPLMTLLTGGCPMKGGCGSCMQGGTIADGQHCDTTRGQNFCQPGSFCVPSTSGGGNSMCTPMCSPFNGPTLCPYGYGCYWPLTSNVGFCVLICPVDPLCLPGLDVEGCSNCNNSSSTEAESLLCLGACCVMDCPGQSSCQFIPDTPIPACLP